MRERGPVVGPPRRRHATREDALGWGDALSVARDLLRRALGACRLDGIDDRLAAVERLRPELLQRRYNSCD